MDLRQPCTNADLLAKLQELLDCCNEIDINTDEIEAKLDSMIVLLISLDGKDFATETTLALIEDITSQITFTGGDLNVNASVSPAAGVKRSIDVVESLIDGSTTDDVQSMSIWFDGKNGTLDGVGVPDGYVASFAPNGGSDTVGSITYTVPDTKGLRVVITYVNKT